MDCLILYASREGQTRRIAETICMQWRAQGADALALPIEDLRVAVLLPEASCVVIGASIHYGHLPKVFYDFVKAHRNTLDARRNAFFCVNLTARKSGKDHPDNSAYIRTFRRRSPWQPQRMAVFAGALRYPRYTWYDRLMIRFIMLMTGGPTDPSVEVEYTDWEKVRAFACECMCD